MSTRQHPIIPISITRAVTRCIAGTTAVCCLLAPVPILAQEAPQGPTEAANSSGPTEATTSDSEDEVSKLQVMVVCDTSELSSDPELIEEQVMIRTKFVLESVGLIPARVPDYMLIRVTLQPLEGSSGFTASLVAEKAGAPINGAAREVACKLCTASELVVQVQEQFSELILELYPDRQLVDPEAESPPDEVSPEPTQPDPAPPQPTDQPSKLGGLGKAGVGAMVLGIVGIGGGIGMIAYGERPRSGDPLDLINLRPPGIGVLAAGVALTIAGGVMVGLDRKRANQRSVAMAPMIPVAGGPAGMVVQGRF